MQESVHIEKVLLAGTMMLLLGVASFVGPVAAQENGVEEEKVRPKPIMSRTLAVGIGAAVDTDEDRMYRSHFRFALSNLQSEEAANTEYEVKKGVFVLNDEGSPVRYHVLPETWTVKVRDGISVFSAEGKVQDIEGKTFEVSFTGELLRETKHGWLYIVKGEFTGGDLDYELYYIAAAIKRPALAQTHAARE